MEPIFVFKLFFIIFGLLIGSFLNVVILRLPEGKSVVTPRSSCSNCGHQLAWFENIPVFSWLLLKAKCRKCGTKISFQYPLIELSVGIISLLLFPKSLTINGLVEYFVFFSIAVSFLAHFIIDIRHQLLPDKINLYLLFIILPYMVMTAPPTFWLIGGLLGFFSTYGITYLFYKLRGQIGLGGGDIKLFGILGLFLGPLGIMNNIFMSCMLGSIVGVLLIATNKMDRNAPFAFGPYIIVTAVFQIFFPKLFELISLI